MADGHLPFTCLLSDDVPLDIKNTASVPDKTNGNIYLFDQRGMVRDVIETPCLRDHLIDQPKKLWHGTAWHATIRASSISDATNLQGINKWPACKNGTPVLFSDFVGFGDGKFQGRIRGIAIDYRSQSQNQGTLHVIVERLLNVPQLPKVSQEKGIYKFDYLTSEHCVLLEEPLLYVAIHLITTKINYTIHVPVPILFHDDYGTIDDNDYDELQTVEVDTAIAKSVIEAIADLIDLHGDRIICTFSGYI
ncbi:hypothetical protein EDC01DRAFT_635774 [Geopyxis carbonaria]|nr:hypothetical protein EDC01DRAFT_635774 [Geopyxis carbonaria]